MKNYDAIIIGTGAAGGIIAGVFAEAGKNVLLLERGPALSFSDVGRDHLRNQRLSVYGHNAGPELDGNPRVFVDPLGKVQTVRPHQPNYHNNAACVGGGTRVYGAQAWRFLPLDFRMASTYGVPEGSSLSDCPLLMTISNRSTSARNGNSAWPAMAPLWRINFRDNVVILCRL